MKVFDITKERLVIGRKEDISICDLLWLSLWIVAFGSIPFLGIGMLLLTILVAFCVLTVALQFPTKLLVFDKTKNLLIIKSKFLLWYPTTQYALNEIVEVAFVAKSIYGSMTVSPIDVVRLTRRKQNGKTSQEDILYGVDANHGVVHQINRFLNY
jgi:ABC-type thiamine transport system substrate-binding protein